MISKKRGQGLSVNMIILIVLGVAVLAVLIIGFTVGWSKLNPFLSTNNVDTIVTSCAVASSTHSVYDFCTAPRDLKAEGVELKGVTCYILAIADDLDKYGVEKASSINCASSVKCEDLKYTEKDGTKIEMVKIIGTTDEDKFKDFCKVA